MKKNLLVIILCACCVTAFAQTGKKGTGKKGTAKTGAAAKRPAAAAAVTPPPAPAPLTDTAKKQVAAAPAKPFERPVDGYFKKTNILSARKTPYAPVREADVVFSKRVWEEFDVREKRNTYMASPKARLIDILMDAVMAGELTAYDPNPSKEDPDGDSFARPLKPAEAKARMADSALINKVDTAGNITASTRVAGEFNPDSIVRFRIKEDWFFDKQRSTYEKRIIGIAPLIKPKAVAGMDIDMLPAFWIYFDAARDILATKEVAMRDNDATGLSYDDMFTKHLFASYVVKQSNEKDERIKDYKQGVDRLYESERIKKQLMDWELDLWQY